MSVFARYRVVGEAEFTERHLAEKQPERLVHIGRGDEVRVLGRGVDRNADDPTSDSFKRRVS